MSASALDIRQVIERTGVPASTLRYYEERGLLAPVGRRARRRQYAADVEERLALIALGRAAGFSLDEIRPMLGEEDGARIDRARLERQARRLDRRIARLAETRDLLLHVAACPADDHLSCPAFRALLDATTAQRDSATRASRRSNSAQTGA